MLELPQHQRKVSNQGREEGLATRQRLVSSRGKAKAEKKIEQAVSRIIQAIGEDPDREGLKGTPRRITGMYLELFAGLQEDPAEELRVGFEEGHHEMVILKEIPFFSMCEHHFLPFFGMASVGYIPNGRVVGVSKIVRVVELYSRRPQLQERLTTQVADTLLNTLNPDGVAVVIQAEHLCMTMRGVKKPGTKVVTSASRGSFRNSAVTRGEFLSLLQGHTNVV